MCPISGAEPKRKTNMCGHFVCLMHSYLPKDEQHAILFTLSYYLMLKVDELNLVDAGIMSYSHAYTSTC